jgi:hypothetical protein
MNRIRPLKQANSKHILALAYQETARAQLI